MNGKFRLRLSAEELESFLFSLGCYSGEMITVVDKKRNLVVSIKDARYNIDPELAERIQIWENMPEEGGEWPASDGIYFLR